MSDIKKQRNKGFTLIEIIIVFSILTMFVVLIGDFQSKIFVFNRIFQTGTFSQKDATNVIKSMSTEIRSMSPSSAGAYALEQAGTSTLIFFNDIDDDNLKERIRYYISGTSLRRGVIKPTGSPLVYSTSTESSITLISNVRNATSSPIFTYYDKNYNGITATSSLPQPIDIISVRLIQINVVINSNTPRYPAPLTVITQVSLRNLKDNI